MILLFYYAKPIWSYRLELSGEEPIDTHILFLMELNVDRKIIAEWLNG